MPGGPDERAHAVGGVRPARRPARVETRAHQLRTWLSDRGGFTLDLREGRLLESGVAVCADPEAACSFPFDRWPEAAVTRWVEEHAPRARDGVFIGGWVDERGCCWLDLVHVYPARLRAAALAAGRRGGQLAAFDLDRRVLIRLSVQRPPGELAPPVREQTSRQVVWR